MLTKADLIDVLRPINEKLDDLEAGQKRIEKRLDQSIQDNTDLFHQTWVSIDEIKTLLERRIDKIEKRALHS